LKQFFQWKYLIHINSTSTATRLTTSAEKIGEKTTEETDDKKLSRISSSNLPRMTPSNHPSKKDTKKLQKEVSLIGPGLSEILVEEVSEMNVGIPKGEDENELPLTVVPFVNKLERKSEEPKKKVGYLIKKGGMRKNWTTRYFILRQTFISYHKSPTETAKGVIPLDAQTKVIDTHDRRAFSFLITNKIEGAREYWVAAADAKEHVQWMDAIDGAIRSLNPSKGVAES
jgi:hypothetical protein